MTLLPFGSSQGPNADFLVTLTLAAFHLSLLHRPRDRSRSPVSSHALSENFQPHARAAGQARRLQTRSPQSHSWLSPEHGRPRPSWGRTRDCWLQSQGRALESGRLRTAPSLKARAAKLQRHLTALSFYRFLFFLLLVKNSNHCQRDLKQRIYFSRSAA